MKVKFLPEGQEFEISPDQTVLEIAQKNNVFIKSVCNGVPNCAECRVRVVEGEHNVFPPNGKEKTLIGTAHFIDQRRLSCQLHCFGDITVDLSEQVEKQKNEGSKKRLKAGVRANVTESRAKSGNLIDQDLDLLKEVDVEVGDETLVEDDGGSPTPGIGRSGSEKGDRNESRQGSQSQNKGPQNKDRNKNRNRKRKKNRNNKSASGDRNNQKSQGSGGSGGGKSSSSGARNRKKGGRKGASGQGQRGPKGQ